MESQTEFLNLFQIVVIQQKAKIYDHFHFCSQGIKVASHALFKRAKDFWSQEMCWVFRKLHP